MKKIILNSLIAALVLGSTGVAFAENDATTTRPGIQPTKAMLEANKLKQQALKQKIASTTEVKKDLRQKMASTTEAKKELRGKIASTTAEKRDERKELIKKRIENRFGKMFLRFQATIDRQEAIMTKINDRIAKIKQNGGNTTEAEKYILEADASLDKAQLALDSLKATAQNDSQIASTTEISKETLESMKKTAKDIEKNLRDVHKSLQKTVGVLKGMSQLKNASSTKETN